MLSNDETFVLGFFSPGTSRKRYVGVWYKFSEDMVVWVANRDDPVNDNSGILTISTDGNLVLTHSDSQGLPLWSSNVSVSPSDTNTMAQLLDSGNLVLVNQDTNHSNVLWQSFDHPTHVLPNMKIGVDHSKNMYLTSWNSNNDPETGNCSLKTELYGSPQIILYNNHAKWGWLSERDAVFVSDKISRQSSNGTFDIILANNEDEVSTTWTVLDHSVHSIIVISGSGTSGSVQQRMAGRAAGVGRRLVSTKQMSVTSMVSVALLEFAIRTRLTG
ncbi:hypothetical protein ACLB2K_024783 [Fragaria x ananassa]